MQWKSCFLVIHIKIPVAEGAELAPLELVDVSCEFSEILSRFTVMLLASSQLLQFSGMSQKLMTAVGVSAVAF